MRFVPATLALLSVAAIGISAESIVPNVPKSNPIPNVPKTAASPTPTGGLGDVCSGSNPESRKCLPGFICSFPMPAPSTSRLIDPPEILGVCIRAPVSSPTPTPKIVGVGEDCGGNAVYANICATGLICRYPDPATLPTGIAYEGPGKCVYPTKTTSAPSSTPKRVAGFGERCYPPGMVNAIECLPGLECVNINPTLGDYVAVCIDPKVNSVITVGIQYPCDPAPKPGQRVCGSGLTCQYFSVDPPGSSGVCKRPTLTSASPSPSPTAQVVGLGESCGGYTMGPAPKCAAGLTCKHIHPLLPDLPGVCVNPLKNSTIIVGGGYPCDLSPEPGQQVCSAGYVCTLNPEYETNFPNYPEMKFTCEPVATTRKSPSPTVGYCAKKFNQCGGNLWQKQLKCCPGTVCKIVNDYYSQCV